MKFFIRICLYILLASPLVAQNQDSQFQLLDLVTKTPLELANINIKGTNFGTISNAEGIFPLGNLEPNTSIQISHLGYKTYTVAYKDIVASKIIYLEPFATNLEEIIVLNESIEKTLATIIATSAAALNKPLIVNTYYREFVKLNDKYTKFSDGIIRYKIAGNSKKMKTVSQVIQSRAANLISEDEEVLNVTAVNDIRNTMENQCGFNYLSKNIANKEFSEKYNYNLKSVPGKDGKEWYKIEFTPKPEVEELLAKGYITYDPDTKLISEVDFQSAASHLQYPKTINILIVKFALLNFKSHQSFQISNGNYVLSNGSSGAQIKIWNKRKYNDIVGFNYTILVTDFNKKMETLEAAKVNKERSLFSYGNQYTTKFWQQENSIVLTEKEQQIIQKLEKEVGTNKE